MGSINWKDKCWFAAVYLVWNNTVLLHNNPRLKRWVPIGGHIEPGQTPDEAIRKEILEETGMEIEFLDNGTGRKNDNPSWKPPQPNHIRYTMTPHHGLHMDLVYFATPKDPKELDAIKGDDEDAGEELRWVSLDEMIGPEFIESLKKDAAEAVNYARKYANLR